MNRHSITATAYSPLSSLEAAVRLTLRTLSAPTTPEPALEELEAEQARIRNSGRHWLIG